MNFNAPITINSFEGGMAFKGVIRGSCKLGVMYVSGQGYKTVLVPQGYLEFPDGKRLPLNFEEFKIES